MAIVRSLEDMADGAPNNKSFAPRLEAQRRLLLLGAAALASLTVACGFGGSAHATPRESVLYSFKNLRGIWPRADLIEDMAGNLYGTTEEGGQYNKGVVFELSQPGGAERARKETVLFSFDGAKGSLPWAGLIADVGGNLYGTTSEGGLNDGGVVFELSPPADGKKAWTETVLFSFDKAKDQGQGRNATGSHPVAGLIADGAGNLYGTASEGGPDRGGVVFELSPPVAGGAAWTETVLLSYNGTNGFYGPQAGLITDDTGNLYGTTLGGTYGDGNVFELSPPQVGETVWTQTVLFSFGGGSGCISAASGCYPQAGLIADGAGNLYGTASQGGAHNAGVVFELSPPAAGQIAWTESVLLSFNKTNGNYPTAGLIIDSAGNLYGTASEGGAQGEGVVFELSPPGIDKKSWSKKIFYSFGGPHGAEPSSALIADGAGNFYGTTTGGGANDAGVVFKLTH